MNKFKCTIKDVTEDMYKATEVNTCYWAFCHQEEYLDYLEKEFANLITGKDKDPFFEASLKYRIVETKNIIVSLYNKLMEFKECKNLDIGKPDWMDEFLNIETIKE